MVDIKQIFGTDAPPTQPISKEEFGRRLYKLMLHRGLRQIELASRTGLTRSSVNGYVKGRAFPTEENLRAMARVLQVDPDVLLPNKLLGQIDEESPSMEIKSGSDPTRMHVRLNLWVHRSTAKKIMDAIEEDGLAYGT